MGRLTLNVLLSFAQFEREVTGERIRDKIAASKKKEIWVGGVVPLGYEVREQKLIVNEEEAVTVRLISLATSNSARFLHCSAIYASVASLPAREKHSQGAYRWAAARPNWVSSNYSPAQSDVPRRDQPPLLKLWLGEHDPASSTPA